MKQLARLCPSFSFPRSGDGDAGDLVLRPCASSIVHVIQLWHPCPCPTTDGRQDICIIKDRAGIPETYTYLDHLCLTMDTPTIVCSMTLPTCRILIIPALHHCDSIADFFHRILQPSESFFCCRICTSDRIVMQCPLEVDPCPASI